MRNSPRPLYWTPIGATFFIAALGAILASFASAQSAPTNSLPNPYQTVTGWFHVPAGRAWGSTAGVFVDAHDHIWVAERCGANSCADSKLDPIFEFDRSGKMLRNFGGGMFVFPHGIAAEELRQSTTVPKVSKTSAFTLATAGLVTAELRVACCATIGRVPKDEIVAAVAAVRNVRRFGMTSMLAPAL